MENRHLHSTATTSHTHLDHLPHPQSSPRQPQPFLCLLPPAIQPPSPPICSSPSRPSTYTPSARDALHYYATLSHETKLDLKDLLLGTIDGRDQKANWSEVLGMLESGVEVVLLEEGIVDRVERRGRERLGNGEEVFELEAIEARGMTDGGGEGKEEERKAEKQEWAGWWGRLFRKVKGVFEC